MKKNVGTGDRVLRAVAAVAMWMCAWMAPLPLLMRVGLFGVMGTYMMFTALAGTCLGYRLMGRSTCPVALSR